MFLVPPTPANLYVSSRTENTIIIGWDALTILSNVEILITWQRNSDEVQGM